MEPVTVMDSSPSTTRSSTTRNCTVVLPTCLPAGMVTVAVSKVKSTASVARPWSDNSKATVRSSARVGQAPARWQ